MQVRHIVFPFDYSDACRRMATRVEAVTRHFDAQVSVVHVLGLAPAYTEDLFRFITDSEMGLMLNRQKDLLRFTAQQCFSRNFLDAAGRVLYVTLEGDPGSRLVKYAREQHADLIMMPTHGVGKFRNLLLGSTTAKVLHDSAAPVWTSFHGAVADALPENGVPKRILCGIDFGPASARVLQTAGSLARSLKASWCVVHALDSDNADEADIRLRANRLLKEAAVQVPLCLGPGTPAGAIRAHALETSTDLVVIGRGALTERFGRLRTNVYAIVRESPCPVLSV